MKRKEFIVAALALFALVAGAVPARRDLWMDLRLGDGGHVRAELHGDEYGRYWVAEDGTCYVRNASSGLYETASLDAVITRASALRETMASLRTPRMRMTIGGEHDPYVGTRKCLVMLVNFADLKFEPDHDNAYYQRMTNEVGFTDASGNIHSVKDYFLAQSHGQLDVDFDVVGPVELEREYAYYGKADFSNAHEMVREGCAYVHSIGTDFSQYDWDGDGEVEQVFVLYAGHGAATWDDQDTVWPHQSSLHSWGGTLEYDGVTIDTYACSNELSGLAASGRADGIGSMCHEFSHCMGLPDIYDTRSGGNYGMATWDVMDLGCYNGDDSGYIPAGYTSYERMYCGWLDPVELSEETRIDGMKGLTDGGEAYVIYNQGHPDEYYLLENRTLTGFDSGLYGSGLLVLHVDFNENIWRQNIVNTTGFGNTHQRCTPIPCDGNFTIGYGSIAGDAWPYAGNNRLDNTTAPACDVFNANSDGGYLMNVSISGIKKAADGAISLDFYPAGLNPNHGNPPDGNVFYESFDYCAGTGGNDGLFGSSITVGPFHPDNDGWECANAVGCDECAYFGSNNFAANVLTPPFTIDGETVFTFRAAPLQAIVPGHLSISVDSGGAMLSESELSIAQGGWTDCRLVLNGTGEVRLRIKETSGLNRFFMDEVAAVPVSAGIGPIEGDGQPARRGSYTLGGAYLGNRPSGLAKGIHIIDGVKAVIR